MIEKILIFVFSLFYTIICIRSFRKGNYSFINTLRNNMTHKFSISQSNMSSFAFEMKHHPSYILKRLCESFATLQDFLYETFDSILKDTKNE